MQSIKNTIEYVLRTLAYFNCPLPSAEQIRVSKQDSPESSQVLQKVLAYIILLDHYEFSQTFFQSQVEIINPQNIIFTYFSQESINYMLYDINSSRNLIILISYLMIQINYFRQYRNLSFKSMQLYFESKPQKHENNDINLKEISKNSIIENYNMIQSKLEKIKKLQLLYQKKLTQIDSFKMTINEIECINQKDYFDDKIKKFEKFNKFLTSEIESFKHEQTFFEWMESVIMMQIDRDVLWEDYEQNEIKTKNQSNLFKEINENQEVIQINYSHILQKFKNFMNDWQFQSNKIQNNPELLDHFKKQSQNIVSSVNSKYIEFETFKKILQNDPKQINIYFDLLIDIQVQKQQTKKLDVPKLFVKNIAEINKLNNSFDFNIQLLIKTLEKSVKIIL